MNKIVLEDEIMLIQFNFKNFRSFRDDVTLDMTATKISEHNHHIVQIGGDKLLTAAGIFGANASGKSNVYQAFEYMAMYVVNSFRYGGEYTSKKHNERIAPTPFLFDGKSKEESSLFEVYFVDTSENGNGKSYNYGFCVDQRGVTEEWLNSKAKTARAYSPVFYRSRDENELDLSGLPKSSRENIQVALEDEVLIVSLGAKLRVSKCKLIRDWFLDTEFVDFGSPIETLIRSRTLPTGFVEDNKVQNDVLDFFATFDDSIKGFEIEQIDSDKEDDNDKRVSIDSMHLMIDSDQYAKMPLSEESAGTLKMFSLYPSLKETLSSGGVVFVDELNARLHPLLVRNFVLTFLNPELNPNHAQIVFTAHDTWQMSNNLLRRDEIWFTDKDADGVSKLYSLADFTDNEGSKIRKDENYEKNYLLGKYGAIPSLKSIALLEGK